MFYEQVKVFGFFFTIVFVMLIFFSLLEANQKCFGFNKIVVFISDFFYMFVVGIVFLLCLIFINGGVMRGYVLLSVVGALIIYFALVHKFVLAFFVRVCKIINRILECPKNIFRKIVKNN